VPGNDDIVLKLIIKGQDPAEIQRLAQETSGRLAQESAAHIGRLTQLHKAAAEEQSAAMKKAIDAEIKDSTRLLDAIQKIERQREIVANRATASWDRMLERLENVTVIAQGLIGAFKSQASAAFALGESIDRITNVYGSLQGSIEQMREAARGEVSDFDLISTKNRALEKDLKLTDEQFGLVAAAADHFADAIGVNTKEALDQLVDGLATGRLKTLEHAGVIVDADAAYERYARSIGTTSDKLSDQGKRIAIIQDALRAMDKKLGESGAQVDDFSHRWEKTTASMSNFADALKMRLGEAIVSVWGMLDSLTDKMAKAFTLSQTQVDILESGKHYSDADLAKMQGRFHGGDSVPEDFLQSDKYKYRGDAGGSIDEAKVAASRKEAARKAEEQARKQAQFNEQFDQMLRGGKGPLYGTGVNNTDYTSDEDALIAQAGGDTVSGGAEEFAKDNEAKAQSYEKLQATVRKEAQDTADKMGAVMEGVVKRRESVESRTGGLMYALLFGQDGPDKTYEEMDAFQQATVDMGGMISETMGKMAEAVGSSLANWVADSAGARKSFRDITNEMLVNLSAQAYTKGLMELAEAAASAATYNYDAAAKHLYAAGAYALVGTAAGVGARAIGHSAPASSSASSTSRPTTSSGAGRSFGSSGSSSSDAGNGTVTFNLTVFPGGEAEAGRQINIALDRYNAQTGRGVRASA